MTSRLVRNTPKVDHLACMATFSLTPGICLASHCSRPSAAAATLVPGGLKYLQFSKIRVMSPRNSARQLYSLLFTRASMIERSEIGLMTTKQYSVEYELLTHWLLDDLVILGVLPLVHGLHKLLAVPVLLDGLERFPYQLVVGAVQFLQVWVVLFRVWITFGADVPGKKQNVA